MVSKVNIWRCEESLPNASVAVRCGSLQPAVGGTGWTESKARGGQKTGRAFGKAGRPDRQRI